MGKSYAIEAFGKTHFSNCEVVNLESHRGCLHSFSTLEPSKIIASLAVLRQQEIIPGQTLLFIDEIQEYNIGQPCFYNYLEYNIGQPCFYNYLR